MVVSSPVSGDVLLGGCEPGRAQMHVVRLAALSAHAADGPRRNGRYASTTSRRIASRTGPSGRP
jgi:hypothetical protein